MLHTREALSMEWKSNGRRGRALWCGALFLTALLCLGGCASSQQSQQNTQDGAIGLAQATEIALAQAGVAESDALDLKAELDAAGAQPVYDVEFVANDTEYDYQIDGTTGDVLWSEETTIVRLSAQGQTGADAQNNAQTQQPAQNQADQNPTSQNSTNQTQTSQTQTNQTQTSQNPTNQTQTNQAQQSQTVTDIGGARAKEIALAQAGVKEADTWDFKTERDYERGKLVYEVEFDTAQNEYEYQIDGTTGEILWSEVQPQKGAAQQPAQTQTSQSQQAQQSQTVTDIGGARAKEIALAQAGVKEADTWDFKTERDYERGKLVYEVDFETAQNEYEYQIDGATGEILWSEVQPQKGAAQQPAQMQTSQNPANPAQTNQAQASQNQQAQQSQTVTDIGGARAKEIALTQAGVKEADTWDLKTERDYERGKLVYEVEFETAQNEYEYQIDGATGDILWSEVEPQSSAHHAEHR